MKITFLDIFLVFALLCALLFGVTQCRNKNSAENLQVLVNDTLTQTRNKLDQQITTTAILYTTATGFKNAVRGVRDSALLELSKIVNGKTMSATVADVTTGENLHEKTTVDTFREIKIIEHGMLTVYPTYRDSFRTNWDTFNISANRDSFRIFYKIKNKFEITNSWKSRGLFKTPIPIATIKDLNPNTSTQVFRSYQLAPAKNNAWYYLGAGILGGIVLDKYLIK